MHDSKNDESSPRPDEEPPKFEDWTRNKLKGNLILVETKQIVSKMTEQQQKDTSKKQFRKLHIVQI